MLKDVLERWDCSASFAQLCRRTASRSQVDPCCPLLLLLASCLLLLLSRPLHSALESLCLWPEDPDSAMAFGPRFLLASLPSPLPPTSRLRPPIPPLLSDGEAAWTKLGSSWNQSSLKSVTRAESLSPPPRTRGNRRSRLRYQHEPVAASLSSPSLSSHTAVSQGPCTIDYAPRTVQARLVRS